LNTQYEQVQEIAYSYDGGFTFIKYAGNPVLALDPGSNQFRDPKVIRYDDSWVMVVSYAQDFVIGIFTSPDLKNWTHASNFSHHGLLGLQYECPNLVQMPVTGFDESIFVLSISINRKYYSHINTLFFSMGAGSLVAPELSAPLEFS
jgi:beta-fructofuranosidase